MSTENHGAIAARLIAEDRILRLNPMQLCDLMDRAVATFKASEHRKRSLIAKQAWIARRERALQQGTKS